MSKSLDNIKNYYQPALRPVMIPQPAKEARNQAVSFRISPVQFERIRHDMQMWREAGSEAENAWYPQRVKMQRMFMDTVLNEHIEACINRRKNLTTLRKFKICNEAGDVDEEATKLFKATWFRNFQSYAIDALLHGYNLITLGDIIKDAFPNLSFVKRQNVSPDRLVVTNFVYSISGAPFLNPDYVIDGKKPVDWTVYITTPTETGAGACGYGLLYKIAKAEIILRNNTGQNSDYNETFGQPVRKGSTNKVGSERDTFEMALKTMGSNAYILLDEGSDTLDLVADAGRGSAHKTYSDLEERLEKKISKVLLGHADALDSTPGKLGAGQDGEESPVGSALKDTQTSDAEFLQPIINEQLIPKMRNLGFVIADGLHFEYVNDAEKEEFRAKEDESNKATADLMKTIKDAGGEPDWDWFSERTGMDVKKAEPPQPVAMQFGQNGNAPAPGIGKENKIAALQRQLKTATGYRRDSIKRQLYNIGIVA